MTKYILHGGMLRPQTDQNKKYYHEIVKDIHAPKILLIYFPREEDMYEDLLNRDKQNFALSNPGKTFEFEIATIEKLADQIVNCNVVFITGGETNKLLERIKESKVDLKEASHGKVVAGSSAGAYLMSEWYYTNGGKEIRQGLGLVDAAVWAHYRADRGSEYWLSEEQIAEIEKELQDKVPGQGVVKLPEQEFIVYNQPQL